MFRFSTFLSTVALLAGAFTIAPGAVDAQTASEERQLTAEGLSLGEEADETAQVGETYIKETFNDWSLRCIVVAEGEDPCQMYQLLSDSSGAPVAEFTMFQLPESAEAAAGATIVVPLETALTQQLAIRVDEEPAKQYPYAFCNTIGCYARIGLTDDELDAYKRGSEAVLSIVPIAAPDQRVNVVLSLNGFTRAFEASTVLSQ
ncbi:invasion associated locus B family protein [Roseobacter weihaiensis]|uniref:invasion associated locus B family protein n=1 Tax=Roseobacter weihaiensis TaxID=2763262 RepID=UPI001D09EDE8|nr:invasion associated locus B family protein [Roseobacter sp. H9]